MGRYNLVKAETWTLHLVPRLFIRCGMTLRQWLFLSEPVSFSVEWGNSVCLEGRWLLLTPSHLLLLLRPNEARGALPNIVSRLQNYLEFVK